MEYRELETNSKPRSTRGFWAIRLKDGRIWTAMTTMSELKGTKKRLASNVRWERKRRRTQSEKVEGRKRGGGCMSSAILSQPIEYRLAAVRAASRWQAGCASECADDIVRENKKTWRSGCKRYHVLWPARSGLVTSRPDLSVSPECRCSPKRQDGDWLEIIPR